VANVTDVVGAPPQKGISGKPDVRGAGVVDSGFRVGITRPMGFEIPVKVLRASADIWD
jgi:hypothetical protein